MRAGRAAELDRRGADAAGCAVDEQALAGAQARLGEDRVVGGREDLGHAAGLRPVERVGHRHQLALVDDAQLGLAAAAGDRHHAVAHSEARGARPERSDLAGELEPRDVLRRARRGRIAALALQHVGAVEPGGADAHEHFAGPGFGVGALLDGDVTVGDHGSPHRRGV